MTNIIIKDVEVYVVDAQQNYVIVRILSNQKGLYGVGDSTLNGRERAVAAYIRDAFVPLLVGQEVRNHNAIWERLYKSAYWMPGTLAMSALSGIDMALWDLRGKIAEQPVWALLGGKFRDSFEVYSHISAKTTEEMAALALQKVKEGCTAIRTQLALDDNNDAYTYGTTEFMPEGHPSLEVWDSTTYFHRVPKMLHEVRKAVGPHIKILHDSHERLSLSEALRFSEKIKGADLFFWEDPFRPETAFESFKMLRQTCTEPLSFGELLHRYDQIEPYLSHKLIDYLRIDLSHFGGITSAFKASHMAQLHDVQMAFHGPPDLSIIGHYASWHVDLAVQNFGIQEYCLIENKVTAELFGHAPKPVNGRLSLPDPDKPGLGCDFNWRAAEKFSYKQRFLPIAVKTDGTVIDW